MFGKDNKKKELVNNLAEIYAQIERSTRSHLGTSQPEEDAGNQGLGLQERDELAEHLKLGVDHPRMFWGNLSPESTGR